MLQKINLVTWRFVDYNHPHFDKGRCFANSLANKACSWTKDLSGCEITTDHFRKYNFQSLLLAHSTASFGPPNSPA